jgi:hypothetical protein
MTFVTVASVKGAPGVTTLACLMGAVWPAQRKAIVVEADPNGGDLAARFRLSSRVGWPSFNAATRRGAGELSVEPHLQQLPGGLDALVGTAGMNGPEAVASMEAFVSSVRTAHSDQRDVLVDIGRVLPWDPGSMAWVGASDRMVVCTRADAASVYQVREKSAAIIDHCQGSVGLAVIGKSDYPGHDIAEFTGIPVIGECALEPVVAAIAGFERPGQRRLRRSSLVRCAAELVSALVEDAPALEHSDSLPVSQNWLRSLATARKKSAASAGGSPPEVPHQGALG